MEIAMQEFSRLLEGLTPEKQQFLRDLKNIHGGKMFIGNWDCMMGDAPSKELIEEMFNDGLIDITEETPAIEVPMDILIRRGDFYGQRVCVPGETKIYIHLRAGSERIAQ